MKRGLSVLLLSDDDTILREEITKSVTRSNLIKLQVLNGLGALNRIGPHNIIACICSYRFRFNLESPHLFIHFQILFLGHCALQTTFLFSSNLFLSDLFLSWPHIDQKGRKSIRTYQIAKKKIISKEKKKSKIFFFVIYRTNGGHPQKTSYRWRRCLW